MQQKVKDRKQIIVLDPGHGGVDPGAVANNLRESELTLKIVNRIITKLNKYDVSVFVTRNDDTEEPGLYQRCELANRVGADFFVSIHVNAGGGAGFESYVWIGAKSTPSDGMRNILHQQVMKYLSKEGVKDRGCKYSNFYVLQNTKMPAVLLECLFIDSLTDSRKLADNNFLDGLANEIAYGIVLAMRLGRKENNNITEAIKLIEQAKKLLETEGIKNE